MSRTRRTIGVGALITLAVLGTGWALEKAVSSSHGQGRPAVVEPAKPDDTVTAPVPQDGGAGKPAATNDQEDDRSDLILTQG